MCHSLGTEVQTHLLPEYAIVTMIRLTLLIHLSGIFRRYFKKGLKHYSSHKMLRGSNGRAPPLARLLSTKPQKCEHARNPPPIFPAVVGGCGRGVWSSAPCQRVRVCFDQLSCCPLGFRRTRTQAIKWGT